MGFGPATVFSVAPPAGAVAVGVGVGVGVSVASVEPVDAFGVTVRVVSLSAAES